jgi:hypothetical protein
VSAGVVVTAVPVLVMVIALGLQWLEARLPTRTALSRRDRAFERQPARESAEGVLRRRAVP